MARQVYNPKQTKEAMMYEYPYPSVINGTTIGAHKIGPFKKDSGYYFSDDKEMDKVVDYFVKELGFKIKGEEKGAISKVVATTEPIDVKPKTTKPKKEK